MRIREFARYINKNFHDSRFYHNKARYIAQCAFATLALFFILLSLNILPNAVVIAAIGATMFILFTMPHRDNSRTRFIVGGYTVGILVGLMCDGYATLLCQTDWPLILKYSDEIFGALAVGISMFLMVMLNLEHPPAAGLSLGMVLGEWSLMTLLVTAIAIGLALGARALFRRQLIDLL